MNLTNYTTNRGIYCIHFSNNKRYIGMSNDIKNRIKEHRLAAKNLDYLPVHKAMNALDYTIEILEDCSHMTREEMGKREQYWIAFYNTYNNKEKGYNLTPGGDGAAIGVDNHSAKLNSIQIQEVYDLLLNHKELFIYEIAARYKISPEAMSDINCGRRYYNEFLNYPLRTGAKVQTKPGINNQAAAFKTEMDLNNVIEDIKDNKLTLYQIADKYGVSYTTISKINRGLTYIIPNYDYPIRKQGKTTTKLTEEELQELINMLINTEISFAKLGKIFGLCKSSVYRINIGKFHTNDKYKYPIRANKEFNKAVSTISVSGE